MEEGVDIPGIIGLGCQLVISKLNSELDSTWGKEWLPEFSQ